MAHNVELDGAGFFSSRPRLTCYTCDGATLVRQPYMGDETWREQVEAFSQAHPSQAGKRVLAALTFDFLVLDRAALCPLAARLPVTAATILFSGPDQWEWTSWGAVALRADGQPVGLATVANEGEGTGEPTLLWLWVEPASRRRGIATLLLQTVLAEARERQLLPLRADSLTPSGRKFLEAYPAQPHELVIYWLDVGMDLPDLEAES